MRRRRTVDQLQLRQIIKSVHADQQLIVAGLFVFFGDPDRRVRHRIAVKTPIIHGHGSGSRVAEILLFGAAEFIHVGRGGFEIDAVVFPGAAKFCDIAAVFFTQPDAELAHGGGREIPGGNTFAGSIERIMIASPVHRLGPVADAEMKPRDMSGVIAPAHMRHHPLYPFGAHIQPDLRGKRIFGPGAVREHGHFVGIVVVPGGFRAERHGPENPGVRVDFQKIADILIDHRQLAAVELFLISAFLRVNMVRHHLQPVQVGLDRTALPEQPERIIETVHGKNRRGNDFAVDHHPQLPAAFLHARFQRGVFQYRFVFEPGDSNSRERRFHRRLGTIA